MKKDSYNKVKPLVQSLIEFPQNQFLNYMVYGLNIQMKIPYEFIIR